MSYLLMYGLPSIFDLILIVELIWFDSIRQRYLNKKKSAGLLHPTDSIPNYDNNTKFSVGYSHPYHLAHADHRSSLDLA